MLEGNYRSLLQNIVSFIGLFYSALVHLRVHMVHMYSETLGERVCVCVCACARRQGPLSLYMCLLKQTEGQALARRIYSLLHGSFAKETYNFLK